MPDDDVQRANDAVQRAKNRLQEVPSGQPVPTGQLTDDEAIERGTAKLEKLLADPAVHPFG